MFATVTALRGRGSERRAPAQNTGVVGLPKDQQEESSEQTESQERGNEVHVAQSIGKDLDVKPSARTQQSELSAALSHVASASGVVQDSIVAIGERSIGSGNQAPGSLSALLDRIAQPSAVSGNQRSMLLSNLLSQNQLPSVSLATNAQLTPERLALLASLRTAPPAPSVSNASTIQRLLQQQLQQGRGQTSASAFMPSLQSTELNVTSTLRERILQLQHPQQEQYQATGYDTRTLAEQIRLLQQRETASNAAVPSIFAQNANRLEGILASPNHDLASILNQHNALQAAVRTDVTQPYEHLDLTSLLYEQNLRQQQQQREQYASVASFIARNTVSPLDSLSQFTGETGASTGSSSSNSLLDQQTHQQLRQLQQQLLLENPSGSGVGSSSAAPAAIPNEVLLALLLSRSDNSSSSLPSSEEQGRRRSPPS